MGVIFFFLLAELVINIDLSPLYHSAAIHLFSHTYQVLYNHFLSAARQGGGLKWQKM